MTYIFCVFDDSAYVNEFLNFLNSYHDNLKFTVENSVNHSLAFLDCLVRKNDDCSFSTTVYRKPTYTGLMLNFCSVCPLYWKRGLVKCLLNRAYNICSSTILFDEQVTYLRKIFSLNAYPISFFNSILREFLHSIRNMSNTYQ